MTRPATDDEPAFEARLRAWLREDLGVSDDRRLARLDERAALVSKFEPGFAPDLHTLLEQLPEIVDERALLQAYALEAEAAPPSTPRLDAWDRAIRRLLRDACAARGITDEMQHSFVSVGVDSVRAVLESVLWSNPRAGDDGYEPRGGERAAYLDATRRMTGHDLFTRHYGTFEGLAIENHCPGAGYARTMLAQGWRVCTGTAPPLER